MVTFEELTAREEVLRKAGMLKGSKVYITEDMSRYMSYFFLLRLEIQ